MVKTNIIYLIFNIYVVCFLRQDPEEMASEENDPMYEVQPVIETGFFGAKYYNNPKSWTEWNRPGALPFLKMKCTERNQANIPSEVLCFNMPNQDNL